MITFIAICILLILGLCVAIPIVLGMTAIVLDVLIGISPFLLAYFIYRFIKRRRNGA